MKHLLSILICLCLSFSAKAQNTYHSMLEGNPEWGYYTLHQGYKLFEEGYDYILTFRKYYLDGQKEINGKTYHCIYMQKKSRDEEMTSPVYCYGVREEAGKVYADYNEFIDNDEYSAIFMPYEVTPDSEVVVYDFTKELNDKFYYYYVNAPSEGVITTREIKSIEEIALNDGSKRKAWRMDDNDYYVEGIGSFNSGGFLTHHLDQILTTGDGMRWHNLNWFKQNGEYVYKAPDYTGDPSVEEESYTTFKKEDPFLKDETNTSGDFTVGTFGDDVYKFYLVDDKYTKDWNVYFAEHEYAGKKVQCGMISDTILAGKTYHIIERIDVNNASDTLLYRQNGKKVYRYDKNTKQDVLLFDFSLKEGDEFVASDGETWIVDNVDFEYKNWGNVNNKLVLVGKEDALIKDVWVENVGSLYTGILSKTDFIDSVTPLLLYCRQLEMTYWMFDVNTPEYDAVFFRDAEDSMTLDELLLYESMLENGPFDDDVLKAEFIEDTLRIYGIMEINCYIYLMECRKSNGRIELEVTDTHFGDEFDCLGPMWVDIKIPGFTKGEYEVVYKGKSLGKVKCKSKEDPFLLAPVFEDGKTWNCEWWTFEGMTNPDTDYNPVAQTYFVDGDTIINNWNCYKLYGKYDKQEAKYIASYYDAGGKAYMVKDGETEGLLIYDFSAKKGDVVNIYDCEDEKAVEVTISDVMTVNMQGREAKCLYVETNDKSTWWIEGIGSVEGFEFNIGKSTPGNTIILGSCYLGDKCLYLKDDNNPNGIDSIATNTTTSDSAIYDLTGRRLNGKPERGIYIQGGKKYVIK